MKRYVGLDFLRGAAIIGVLGFHVLTRAYNTDKAFDALKADPVGHLPFLILVALLLFAGEFDVLFIALSAAVNTITVHKQWHKKVKEDSPMEEKKAAYNAIFKSQFIRGLIIIALGYISEVFLNGALLDVIIGDTEDLWERAFVGFFFAQVLVLIGIGVIVSAFIYLQLLIKGYNKKEIEKRLVIGAFIIIALTPVIASLVYMLPGDWGTPGRDWMNRSLGMNILYAFLSVLVVRFNPVFPTLSMSLFGTIIGMEIADGKVTKEFLNSVIKLSGVLFILGFIAAFIDNNYDLDEFLMPSGGSLLLIVLILYLVDVRGKSKKFAQNPVGRIFLRFGLVTLTLWCLQWLMVFPLMVSNWIYNLVHGTSYTFMEGPIMNKQLSGWEVLGYLMIIYLMWYVLLLLWGKINFVGSFEWMVAKMMSRTRPDASKRLNMNETIYNIEPIIKEPQNFYTRGQIAGMIALLVFYSIVFLASQVL